MLMQMVRDGDGFTLTQRVLHVGAESLTAVELMAVALGDERDDTLDSLRNAYREAGSIRQLMESGAGFTGPKTARFAAALELARRAEFEQLAAMPSIRNITHQLRDALQLIGVRVLDHLVVGAGEPTSMAARGLI